jgi:hypothetical protein
MVPTPPRSMLNPPRRRSSQPHSQSNSQRQRSNSRPAITANDLRERELPPVPPQPPRSEDDYCPLCHQLLPEKDTDQYESQREEHIAQCEERFFGTSARPAPVSRAESSSSMPTVSSTAQSSDNATATGGETLLEALASTVSSSSLLPRIPSGIAIGSRTTSSPQNIAGSGRHRVSASTDVSHSHSHSVNPYSSSPSFASGSSSVPAQTLGRRHTASEGSRPSNPDQHIHSTGNMPRILPTGPRMLTYLATEKDCIKTDENNEAETECVICFEEFEVGVEMARLECLCRFHKVCTVFISHCQLARLFVMKHGLWETFEVFRNMT